MGTISDGGPIFEGEPQFTDKFIARCFRYWLQRMKIGFVTVRGTLFVCNRNKGLIDHYSFRETSDPDKLPFINQYWNRLQGLISIDQLAARHAVFVEIDHISRQALGYSLVQIPEIESPIVLGFAADTASKPEDIIVFLQSLNLSFEAIIDLKRKELEYEKLEISLEETIQAARRESERLHALLQLQFLIDADAILTELMKIMQLLYPADTIELYFSQDHHNPGAQVKPIVFNRLEDLPHIHAFVEGKPQYCPTEQGCIFAAPLLGQQGVYGVLQVISAAAAMPEADTRFISFAAETAGVAFEKAKLYEQSNFLINELRLVNEITSRLNQSLNPDVIYEFATQELLQIFNAGFCTILEVDRKKKEMIVKASNVPGIGQNRFSLEYGFSGLIYASKEPVYVSDYIENPQVNSKVMELTGARSLIASPILVNGEVLGVIMICHCTAYYFTYGNYRLLQALSAHIGLAMSNASLHEEVHRMVITDRLTELYTRHYLNEQVNRLQHNDTCGSLIVLDIDNFKKVNDTHGHQVGDQILVQVCRIILTSIREKDVAARWGGEELAVYLPLAGKEQAVRVAERIRYRVFRETSPQVTVSCGISAWRKEDEKISVETLFYRADMALYEAKRSGKNQVAFL